jgi:hypothetical protein
MNSTSWSAGNSGVRIPQNQNAPRLAEGGETNKLKRSSEKTARRWFVEVAHRWFNRFLRLLVWLREARSQFPGAGALLAAEQALGFLEAVVGSAFMGGVNVATLHGHGGCPMLYTQLVGCAALLNRRHYLGRFLTPLATSRQTQCLKLEAV